MIDLLQSEAFRLSCRILGPLRPPRPAAQAVTDSGNLAFPMDELHCHGSTPLTMKLRRLLITLDLIHFTLRPYVKAVDKRQQLFLY